MDLLQVCLDTKQLYIILSVLDLAADSISWNIHNNAKSIPIDEISNLLNKREDICSVICCIAEQFRVIDENLKEESVGVKIKQSKANLPENVIPFDLSKKR